MVAIFAIKVPVSYESYHKVICVILIVRIQKGGKSMPYPTKELQDIERGDILLTRITFEENTSDYYSGHNPFDIITRARTDKDGNISKTRPVIVLDRLEQLKDFY